MNNNNNKKTLHTRFRGFYPVLIDVETSGLNSKINALLEIATTTFIIDSEGWLQINSNSILNFNIKPFAGSILQPEALALNHINPYNPLRSSISEYEALSKIFKMVYKGIKEENCNRAIVVAHNAAFDHSFLMAAIKRTGIKNNPFHTFVTFDTATLSGLAFGQTVLAKACDIAGICFDNNEAHSALYDTKITAELFCEIVNKWKRLGGWPIK